MFDNKKSSQNNVLFLMQGTRIFCLLKKQKTNKQTMYIINIDKQTKQLNILNQANFAYFRFIINSIDSYE